MVGLFKNHSGGQMVLQTAQEGHRISSWEALRTDLDKILGSPVADPALTMELDQMISRALWSSRWSDLTVLQLFYKLDLVRTALNTDLV